MDVTTSAVVGAVCSMLLALVTLAMRVMLRTGDQSGKRYEAEIGRLQKENQDLKDDRDHWLNAYLKLLGKTPTGEDDEP